MAVKTLKVDLPAEIFDAQASVPLLHQVVVAQLAAARQGTHNPRTAARFPVQAVSPSSRRVPVTHVRAPSVHRT